MSHSLTHLAGLKISTEDFLTAVLETVAMTAWEAPGPTGAVCSGSRTGLPPSTAGSGSRAQPTVARWSRPPSRSPASSSSRPGPRCCDTSL